MSLSLSLSLCVRWSYGSAIQTQIHGVAPLSDVVSAQYTMVATYLNNQVKLSQVHQGSDI